MENHRENSDIRTPSMQLRGTEEQEKSRRKEEKDGKYTVYNVESKMNSNINDQGMFFFVMRLDEYLTTFLREKGKYSNESKT